MMSIAAGFVLGAAASVHCVMMCGPLMMAMLARQNRRAAILYHGGRLTMYAMLGAVTGAAGHLAGLAGAGRLLSVVAGLSLIWAAARRAGWLGAGGELGFGRHVSSVIVRAAHITRVTWHEASPLRLVSAGILNGLLPCGPVYAALSAAAALGDSRQSAAFMLAFGAGTLPALAAVSTIAVWPSRLAGRRWRFITPATLAVLGVLLLARGLTSPHHHAEARLGHDHATHAAAHASNLVAR
jgi:sulfite exporter TauE/SafE